MISPLFFHPNFELPGTWQALMELLAKRGVPTLALDLRGEWHPGALGWPMYAPFSDTGNGMGQKKGSPKEILDGEYSHNLKIEIFHAR